MESGLSFDEVLVDEDSSAALTTSCEDVNMESDVVSAALRRRKDRRLLPETMPLSLLSSLIEVEDADNCEDEDDDGDEARQWRDRESCTHGEGAKAKALQDESDDSMATSSSEAQLILAR